MDVGEEGVGEEIFVVEAGAGGVRGGKVVEGVGDLAEEGDVGVGLAGRWGGEYGWSGGWERGLVCDWGGGLGWG